MTYSEFEKDPLTGLVSRAAFDTAIISVISDAANHQTPFTLAFMDIDNFLTINEQFGRDTGDTVLKGLAKLILENVGESVIVARYGGDEYAVLFPHTEREQAFLTMERVREAVETGGIVTSLNLPTGYPLTVTIGIASYPIDGSRLTDVLRMADQALYRAKVTGRNCVRLAYEERMSPKTSHYTLTQLERLSKLANDQGIGEAVLLREALDDLLRKYGITLIES